MAPDVAACRSLSHACLENAGTVCPFSPRGYSEKKVGENVECEIMQVVLEEAKESYPEEAVHEVPSNTIEELESNVTRVQQWLDAWRTNNAS